MKWQDFFLKSTENVHRKQRGSEDGQYIKMTNNTKTRST